MYMLGPYYCDFNEKFSNSSSEDLNKKFQQYQSPPVVNQILKIMISTLTTVNSLQISK